MVVSVMVCFIVLLLVRFCVRINGLVFFKGKLLLLCVCNSVVSVLLSSM